MNMLSTIVPKSDQINADDLIGQSRTIRINEVQFKGGQEQPVSMFFDGSDKAFRPCKSMCRVLVALWGPDANAYVGRSMTLYRDADVKWGGMKVGGIRISHMSDIDEPRTMALTETKGSRKPFTVKPLQVEAAPADRPATTPDSWTDRAIAAIDATADEAALTATMKRLSTNANKLSSSHPELFQRIADAERDARARHAREGRTDEQHGDQFDDTDDPFGLPKIDDALIAANVNA